MWGALIFQFYISAITISLDSILAGLLLLFQFYISAITIKSFEAGAKENKYFNST